MSTTAKDRKRAEYARHRQAGHVPVLVWVFPLNKERLLQCVKELNTPMHTGGGCPLHNLHCGCPECDRRST